MKVNEFKDVGYLQRVVTHLYDLLDDIDAVDDIAKEDDALYREIVQKIQASKNDSGVKSPDGYFLHIEKVDFSTKSEIMDGDDEQVPDEYS